MQDYVPDLYSNMGSFKPLIEVICTILGRAEAYATKHNLAS